MSHAGPSIVDGADDRRKIVAHSFVPTTWLTTAGELMTSPARCMVSSVPVKLYAPAGELAETQASTRPAFAVGRLASARSEPGAGGVIEEAWPLSLQAATHAITAADRVKRRVASTVARTRGDVGAANERFM